MIAVKGFYIVTDPCYILDDSEYDAFLSKMEEEDYYGFDEFTINGKQIIYGSTCYGDGSYPVFNHLGEEIYNFGVDSGLQCLYNVTGKVTEEPQLYLEGDIDLRNGNFIFIKDGQSYTITNTRD